MPHRLLIRDAELKERACGKARLSHRLRKLPSAGPCIRLAPRKSVTARIFHVARRAIGHVHDEWVRELRQMTADADRLIIGMARY